MIQDIDEINVVLSDPGSVDISIDNDNSISVSEAAPTDIAQIMHNEEIRQENEAQRIANEEQRIANEEAREDYINDLKQRVLDGEFNGEDGYSPTATVSKTDSTATITITDKNGTTTAQISDGQDGQDGADGQDGFSPVANVSKSGDTATITITDKNGTTTSTISDGANGQDGADGYSPSASVTKSGSVATITITDKSGTTTANIYDGTGSGGIWGSITGTLSDQTDLQNALDTKQNIMQYETMPTATASDVGRVVQYIGTGTTPYLHFNFYVGKETGPGSGEYYWAGVWVDDLSGYQRKIDSSNKLNSDLVDDSTSTNKFINSSAQTFTGTKTFSQINTGSETITSNLTTYSSISINDDEDGSVFSFDGTSSGTPAFARKIDLMAGGETITPTSNNDIANKKYVDDSIPDVSNFISTSSTSGLVKNDGTIDTTSYSTFSGSYTDLSNKPTIPDELADLSDDSTHRVVTDTEKTTWSGKQDALVSGTNIKTINGNSILTSGDITVPDKIYYCNEYTANDYQDLLDIVQTMYDEYQDGIYSVVYIAKAPSYNEQIGFYRIVEPTSGTYRLQQINYNKVDKSVYNGETTLCVEIYYIAITVSGGVVSINPSMSLIQKTIDNYLSTTTDYGATTYTPTYDGSPATKKYVDDNKFSGSYTDLTNKPNLSAVATSGSYNDLSNKPTIPTVNTSKTTSDTATYSCTYINNQLTDSGWVDLSNYVNTTYFKVRTGFAPKVRKVGNTVYFTGYVYCKSSVGSNVGKILNAIPSAYRPTAGEMAGGGCRFSTNNSYSIWIENGEIKVAEGSNITTQNDYQGYYLGNLGPYLVN